ILLEMSEPGAKPGEQTGLPEELAKRENAAQSEALTVGGAPPSGSGRALRAWMGARLARGITHFLDFFSRGRAMTVDSADDVALSRTGGPVARWVSFPQAVRTTT